MRRSLKKTKSSKISSNIIHPKSTTNLSTTHDLINDSAKHSLLSLDEDELNNSFDDIFPSKNENTSPLFFFVNPKSGSHHGCLVLNLAGHLEEKESDSTTKDPSHKYRKATLQNIVNGNLVSITCVFVNILNDDEMQDAIALLKIISENKKEKVKILIGGGDGTVLSLVEFLQRRGINVSKLIFGHVPLGTGNDLSNALGYGGSMIFEEDEFFLFDLLFNYQNSQECKIDVWSLELKVDDRKGKICQIDSHTVKVMEEYSLMKGKNVNRKLLRKTFINYFSIGYEARAGFSFEKQRSKNRYINKCIYAYKGFQKFFKCCTRNYFLTDLIYSFQIGENTISCPFSKQKTFAFGKKILYQTSKNASNTVLSGNPISIVCQNINCYLGGSKNIWRNSGSNIGVTGSNNEGDFNEDEKKSLINSINRSQKFDDKKLEFFIYDTGVEVGLENIFSGHAHKIYHGEGPVRIVFRKGSKGKLYLNIDGEYFRIYEPEYIKIVNNINLSNGQINFLRRSGGEFFES